MKKLFKWLLFLTLVFAIGATALIYNPGWFKGPLERKLSALAGYPISIEGELDIGIGRLLEISASDVSLSAPTWSSHEELIKLGSLKLALVTGSLFEDILVLDSLQLGDLQTNLETKPDGTGNWISNRPQVSKTSADDEGVRVVFNSIQIENASLRYINGEKGLEHILNIFSLKQEQQADGMLRLNVLGDLNDTPLELSGNIGPYENLLSGSNITYSGSGKFGSLSLSSDGLIDDARMPHRPPLNIRIEGPDIDEITAALGLDDLGSGPFSLLAKAGTVDDHYDVSLDGDVGDISISVSARVSDLSQLDELDLSVAINGPDLGSFTRSFGVEKWPDKPFSLNAEVKRVGDTLNIPTLTLNIAGTELVLDALLSNFPGLDSSRIKLSIRGDNVVHFRELLGMPGIAHGPFDLTARLAVNPEGQERLNLEANTSLGHATLSGTLGAAPSYEGSKIQLHLDGDNANNVMSAFGVDALPEQAFSLNSRIEVVENGLQIERGVLVTIGDERLELGGFVALNPGSIGTDLNVRLFGKHLNRVLRRLVADTAVPDQAYDLKARIHVLEEGFKLEKLSAGFAGIELEVDGIIDRGDQPLGSGLEFQLSGVDLSALGDFEIVGDALGIFVPGQPYMASGRLATGNNSWKLDNISGRIGSTDFTLDSLISQHAGLVGSSATFSIKGSDIYSLLIDQDASDLPLGAFSSSGRVSLSEETLDINAFTFETEMAQGEVDLALGWPISRDSDTTFKVNIRGDDIRHLLPQTDNFEPNQAAYKLSAIGEKQGEMISIQQAEAQVGDLHIKLSGNLDDRATNENASISFTATSPDLSTLGLLKGDRLPSMPLEFNADFNGDTRQFALNNISITLGESHITGMLDVSMLDEKPNIKLNASSEYIDLRPFKHLTDEEDEEDETSSNEKPERMIPPTPLPIDALAAVDMMIKLEVAEIRHQKDSLENMRLEAVVEAGNLNVSKLDFEGPRGRLESSFSIHPTTDKLADVQLDLTADKLVLNLSGQPDENLDLAPVADIRVHVSGSGSNLQEVAAASNGTLFAGSPGGSLPGVNLNVLDTFILDELFSLILPKSDKSEDLELTCAATILKITDGRVETDPALAFTTDKITLVAKGSLDLKTEKMKINFNATPNNALKLSASELLNPYILVGGTLSKPAVGLDPGKALLLGSAAVGTAGISILAKGLYDRVSTIMPLCEEMLSLGQPRPTENSEPAD